ncbi:MAG: hypothetical protein KM296_02995 [Brockia lithotrophica]|nr:hypothetical protein [Brockia lithotrophica]
MSTTRASRTTPRQRPAYPTPSGLPLRKTDFAWLVAVFALAFWIGQNFPLAPLAPKASFFWTRGGPSPEHAAVALLDGARTRVDVAMYDLTNPAIADAILRARARGIPVRLITDARQSQGDRERGLLTALQKSGVDVRVNQHEGLMHLKLFLVDGEVAALGSYNATLAASRSNEELLAILGNPATVAELEQLFERTWAQGAPLDRSPTSASPSREDLP